MKFQYAPCQYDIAEDRILFTHWLDGGRYLDVVVQGINPVVRDAPPEVAEAFKSVILTAPELGDPQKAAYEWEYVNTEMVARMTLTKFPELEDDPRTAYIYPIISESNVGYHWGFVVAWNEKDARTVAEYMAGGLAEIYLDLVERDGELAGSTLLGKLSYSDVVCDTDAYRRIIQGEEFVEAVEERLGIEAPEPKDPERPGAELLKTFRKVR